MGAGEMMRSAFGSGRQLLLANTSLLAALAAPSLAQSPSAVPPPVEQVSADCSRPQYASDRLVCDDPDLRALDADVARLGRVEPRLADGAVWEGQSAWFRRRAQCAFQAEHRSCLIAAYTDRRAVLEAAHSVGERALRCDGAWQGRPLAATVAIAGKPLSITENGLLVATASPVTGRWQPWLTWRASGSRIVFEPRTGLKVWCRIGKEFG